MTSIILHGTDAARACGIEVKGRGMAGPIGPLCRRLIEERRAKPFNNVMIYRGETLCFHPAPLIWWASMHTSEGASSSVRTDVHKPRPDLATPTHDRESAKETEVS